MKPRETIFEPSARMTNAGGLWTIHSPGDRGTGRGHRGQAGDDKVDAAAPAGAEARGGGW